MHSALSLLLQYCFLTTFYLFSLDDDAMIIDFFGNKLHINRPI